MEGTRILAMFNDAPLTQNEAELFVNRKEELMRITNIGRFMQKTIYGIAGETGCGKTTIFNMLQFHDIEKIIISITEKESKEVIIGDILYKLCEQVLERKKFKDLHKLANSIIGFLEQEELRSRAKGLKIGKIIEGESKWIYQAKYRYTIPTLKNKLKEIITAITRQTKCVLCIDEIDKENKKDAIIILDSIKDILKVDNLSCIVALPPEMYKQYIEDRITLFSEANLQNILKDIIPINKMDDKDIEEILNRRISMFPEILPEEVKKAVIMFADGNPREALLLCQNTLLSKNIGQRYKKEDFIISMDELKHEMYKFVRASVNKAMLTKREHEFLMWLRGEGVISKAEILNAKSLNMPSSTRHTVIKTLTKKGVITPVNNDKYKLARKIQIYYKYFA